MSQFQSLRKFALDSGMTADPSVEPNVPIHYLIELSQDGSFVGITKTEGKTIQTGKNKKQLAKIYDVPALHGYRGNSFTPRLGNDKVDYLIQGTATADPEKVKANYDLMEAIYKKTGCPEAEAVVKFGEKMEDDVFRANVMEAMNTQNVAFKQVGKAISDTIAFILTGQNEPVFATPVMRKAWKEEFEKLRAKNKEGLCFVCGKRGEIQNIHRAVKGFPGTHVTGASICSWNEPTAIHYGKKQGMNAPMCIECADLIAQSLTYLGSSDKHTMRFTQKNGKGLALSISSWITDPSVSMDKTYSFIKGPSVLEIGNLLKQPFKPTGSQGDMSEFCILFLTGNKKRLSTLLYQEKGLEKVRKSLIAFYEDLGYDWERIQSMKKDKKAPGLWHLLSSFHRDVTEAPQKDVFELLEAALFGLCDDGSRKRLPYRFLGQALNRANAEVQNPFSYRPDFLRLCLARCLMRGGVNVEKKRSAEQFGRLFAITEMAYASSEKSRETNDTFSTSRLRGAYERPSYMLTHCLTNFHTVYIPKMKDRGYWPTAEFLIQREEDALAKLNGTLIPMNFGEEEKAAFIIGYSDERRVSLEGMKKLIAVIIEAKKKAKAKKEDKKAAA